MRVLFDIVHPAHAHFYHHLHHELVRDGHETLVISRRKEVTTDLLDEFSIPHTPVGAPSSRGLLGAAGELLRRDVALIRAIRRFKPDVVLTRNPSGVQAARFTGTTGVFDTDDGHAVGIHFRAAAPFAHIITTPRCLREDLGPRHRRYPSFKALAYLHPDRFTPDPDIREQLGVGNGPLFLVRFSAHTASHDSQIEGLSSATRNALVDRLAAVGQVVISDEGELPPRLEPYRVTVPPHRLHDVLSVADLCVGDSQTVAAEAALLGTPAIRLSSFSGRVDYLRELEDRYGLIRNFRPGEESEMFAAVGEALEDLASLNARAAASRTRLLLEHVDLTSWYRQFLDELVGSPRN